MNHIGKTWLRSNPGLPVLLLLIFIVYAGSLTGDFVVDDVPVIRDNPFIQESGHLRDFFSHSLWETTAIADSSVPMYRPLFHVFHTLSYKLWGSNPLGYHVVLLLVHMLNTCLVYAMIRSVASTSAMAATFGAAVFALNPARVESVAWISGITDPLATLFLLLALLTHRLQAERPGKPWFYLLALTSFQLALWNKEVALIFPLVIVAHDLIHLKKIRWRISLLYVALAISYLFTRNTVLGPSGTWDALQLPHSSRLIEFMLGYSGLLTFPTQIPFFLAPPQHIPSSPLNVIGALTMLALIAFAWRRSTFSQRRTVTFSLIWTLAFSWSALLMLFYHEGFYSARFLYIPAVGLALFLAVLYDQLVLYPGLKKNLIASVCALLIAYYSIITWNEIPAWHDDGSIYTKIILNAPEDSGGYLGLASFHYDHEDYVNAEANYLSALRKKPSKRGKIAALVALGNIRGMSGDTDTSKQYLTQAVQLDPTHSEAWTGLGNVAWMQGRINDAISAYEKALSSRSGNYEAAMNLATLYERSGQRQRANTIRLRFTTRTH